jgi:hypothetical protein
MLVVLLMRVAHSGAYHVACFGNSKITSIISSSGWCCLVRLCSCRCSLLDSSHSESPALSSSAPKHHPSATFLVRTQGLRLAGVCVCVWCGAMQQPMNTKFTTQVDLTNLSTPLRRDDPIMWSW